MMKFTPVAFFLLVFLSLLAWFACRDEHKMLEGLKVPRRIVIVAPPSRLQGSTSATNDYKSLKKVISVSGILMDELEPSKISSEALSAFDLIVVPQLTALALDTAQMETILKAVKQGKKLYFDGSSPLSSRLGMKLSDQSLMVKRIKDVFSPKEKLYWLPAAAVNTIETKGKAYKVICKEDSLQRAIVVKGKLEQGEFIFSSPLFDPNTDKGYSRFPFLIETFEKEFGIYSMATKSASEMFLDVSDREEDDWDTIAVMWRERGIKRVFASAWYYDTGKYNYEKLINACHQNGIAIYSWLEPPMVSVKFWKKHPEWREKTSQLKDAAIDWRLLMNFADENCRKQILAELDTFMSAHEWDGLNLAEFYFEPVGGLDNPPHITPMNDIVRADFEKEYGFDPILIFDKKSPHYWEKGKESWMKFIQFRKNLSFKIKDIFLEHFQELKKQRTDFELMLTAIDVFLAPDVAANIGEDGENTMKLYKKFDLALQVEDPGYCWGLTPERYDKLGKEYRKYVKENDKLLFDCNVIENHPLGDGGFPAQVPSGEEIRQITYNIAKSNSRPVFYSENTIIPRDFININRVLATPYRIDVLRPNRWKVSCSKTIQLKVHDNNVNMTLDGEDWFAQDSGCVIVPKGSHILEFKSIGVSPYSLLRISGELISAEFANATAKLVYTESGTSCFATFSKKPKSIEIDGVRTDCKQYHLVDDVYTVRLPAGKHTALAAF